MHLSSVLALGLFTSVRTDVYQRIVGTYGIANLYTLEFDDSSVNLDLIGDTTANAASSWIALSHNKENFHGTSTNTVLAFRSCTLANATDIIYNTLVEFGGDRTSSKSIFVMAASDSAYAVYGTPFGNRAGCGIVISVDENVVLSERIQNYTYASTSGVHGMALDSTNTFVYSADDSASTLWTPKVDNTTGELTLATSPSIQEDSTYMLSSKVKITGILSFET